MMKMMSDMSNRMVGEMTNMVGEVNDRVGEMNGRMGEMSQTVNSHSQSIAKLETQVGQMANTLNRREEGKLPSQPVVNPKELYTVNEETSHHQHVQSITTLRSGKLVDNQVEDKKDEQIEVSETLQRDKGKPLCHIYLQLYLL
jgi:TolA-binding protein